MTMAAPRKPLRWQGSDNALRAVQVAFDVEEAVMEAVRVAAFEANVSTSTQIRDVLGLPVPAERPKRPRLTVTLSGDDYALLAGRYGLPDDDRLGIKEAATRELIGFATDAPAPQAQAKIIAACACRERDAEKNDLKAKTGRRQQL
jgi:hypothetical protein